MWWFVPQQSFKEKLTTMQEECRFYKEINAQMELNRAQQAKACKDSEESSRAAVTEKDAQIRELQEQVCDFPRHSS